jgi:hypothetical protein
VILVFLLERARDRDLGNPLLLELPEIIFHQIYSRGYTSSSPHIMRYGDPAVSAWSAWTDLHLPSYNARESRLMGRATPGIV